MKNTSWIHEFNIMVQNRTNTDKLENSIWNWEELKLESFSQMKTSMNSFGHYLITWKFQVKKKLFNIQIFIIKFFNFSTFPTRTLVGKFLLIETCNQQFPTSASIFQLKKKLSNIGLFIIKTFNFSIFFQFLELETWLEFFVEWKLQSNVFISGQYFSNSKRNILTSEFPS